MMLTFASTDVHHSVAGLLGVHKPNLYLLNPGLDQKTFHVPGVSTNAMGAMLIDIVEVAGTHDSPLARASQ